MSRSCISISSGSSAYEGGGQAGRPSAPQVSGAGDSASPSGVMSFILRPSPWRRLTLTLRGLNEMSQARSRLFALTSIVSGTESEKSSACMPWRRVPPRYLSETPSANDGTSPRMNEVPDPVAAIQKSRESVRSRIAAKAERVILRILIDQAPGRNEALLEYASRRRRRRCRRGWARRARCSVRRGRFRP